VLVAGQSIHDKKVGALSSELWSVKKRQLLLSLASPAKLLSS